ncbi:MAG: pyruvate kinase [Crenarchaeota archaeon]|nr:pyruvate kinase [Thermoproteota archaeon]
MNPHEWMPVKIIATLGPSSQDPKTIESMIREGAWGLRINMSHGDPDYWNLLVENALEAESQLGIHVALIADLEGPRVRVSRQITPIKVREGDKLRFCIDSERTDCIPVSDAALFRVMEEGDTIILGDGILWFTVTRVSGSFAEAISRASGLIKPGMGVAIRGKDLPLPPITRHDEEAIKFIKNKPFSHVMMSYVRSGENIDALRGKLREEGLDHLNIIAKIESPGGVMNAEEIAEKSDGIVIARGDLGMHYSLEDMPVVQTELAWTGLAKKKPVIVATELLTSMIDRVTPTRSEITDIFQAVKEGADALLLTAETAIGKYPVRAVAWARRAANRAFENSQPVRPASMDRPENLALGLIELAESIDAPLLVYSIGGRLPNRLANFKPGIPVYVGVGSVMLERKLRIRWGIAPVLLKAESYIEGMEKLYEKLSGYLGGRLIVLAAWSREEGVFEIKIRNLRY